MHLSGRVDHLHIQDVEEPPARGFSIYYGPGVMVGFILTWFEAARTPPISTGPGFDVVFTAANPHIFDVVSTAANPPSPQIDVVLITAKSRAPKPQQNRRGFPKTTSIFQWFPTSGRNLLLRESFCFIYYEYPQVKYTCNLPGLCCQLNCNHVILFSGTQTKSKLEARILVRFSTWFLENQVDFPIAESNQVDEDTSGAFLPHRVISTWSPFAIVKSTWFPQNQVEKNMPDA